MQIFVTTPAAKTITLDVAESYTIDNVKFMVAGHPDGKVPPGMQRLLFGGKDVEGDMTLGDYNIASGSTLHLSLTLDGGAGNSSRDKVKKVHLKRHVDNFTRSEDQQLFLDAHAAAVAVLGTQNVEIVDLLGGMSVEDLERIQEHFNHSKEKVELKVQGLAAYTVAGVAMTRVQQKMERGILALGEVVLTSAMYQYGKENGSWNIEHLKRDVAVALVKAQNRRDSGAATASSVATGDAIMIAV